MEHRIRSLLVIAGLCIIQSTGIPRAIFSINPSSEAERSTRDICQPSVTTVGGRQVCKKEVIFEDNFDTLDETKWRKDLMIADQPDYEFVIFEKSSLNSFVEDGILHLKPTVPPNVEKLVITRKIDLRKRGCTGTTAEECVLQPSGANIVPPVISARIKTTQSFSFKYGVVEVRAKLPDGNWLYPQIWLEPVEKFYGKHYDSGRIVIAMAKGNPELDTPEGEDIGAALLTGGLILCESEPCRSELLRKKRRKPELEEGWNEAFHTYKVTWSPEEVVLEVDGEEYGRIAAIPLGGFGSVFDTTIWDEGSDMAPFDREFYLTLGVGAGGFSEFPDNSTIAGHTKPWKNRTFKARVEFLNDLKHWKESWAWEDAALQVDYIKVWAL